MPITKTLACNPSNLLIRLNVQLLATRDGHVLLAYDEETAESQPMFRDKEWGQECSEYPGKGAEIAARILEDMGASRDAGEHPLTVQMF